VGGGLYRIKGQKIFISYGDHDWTDNIVHMVLARTPDAPGGIRGVSLFIVPKILVNEDGSLGARNDLRPVGLEHKLGIHASPTCVMAYGEGDGALGLLVGEENRGIQYMFTMMNNARLHVGLEAVGLAEAACQKAVDFASGRVQGRPPGRSDGTIIHHPDVGRMILLMKSITEAARGICYATAGAIDQAAAGVEGARARSELLVPLAKGWSTELCQEVASMCLQIHGGMGYVEETGVAQLVRDARITTIYEGTTAIQANDFIGRKTHRDGGAELSRLLHEIGETCVPAERSGQIAEAGAVIGASRREAEQALAWLLRESDSTRCAAAVNFLMGCGTLVGGWLLLKSALAAAAALERGQCDAGFQRSRIDLCSFYAAHMLPRADALFRAACNASPPGQSLANLALGA